MGKRPSKNPEIHRFAEKIRRMTDEQIYHEVHPDINLEFIEKVIAMSYDDILSVLAPHFGDDIMAKIEEVLSNWYHVAAEKYKYVGEVREGGIDRPLTEKDRMVTKDDRH